MRNGASGWARRIVGDGEPELVDVTPTAARPEGIWALEQLAIHRARRSAALRRARTCAFYAVGAAFTLPIPVLGAFGLLALVAWSVAGLFALLEALTSTLALQVDPLRPD